MRGYSWRISHPGANTVTYRILHIDVLVLRVEPADGKRSNVPDL